MDDYTRTFRPYIGNFLLLVWVNHTLYIAIIRNREIRWNPIHGQPLSTADNIGQLSVLDRNINSIRMKRSIICSVRITISQHNLYVLVYELRKCKNGISIVYSKCDSCPCAYTYMLRFMSV